MVFKGRGKDPAADEAAQAPGTTVIGITVIGITVIGITLIGVTVIGVTGGGCEPEHHLRAPAMESASEQPVRALSSLHIVVG